MICELIGQGFEVCSMGWVKVEFLRSLLVGVGLCWFVFVLFLLVLVLVRVGVYQISRL